MKWNILSSQLPQSLSELEGVLLANRGVSDRASFFAPKHPSQFSLAEVGIDAAQMKLAVERILLARERREDVLIFGDYDADGVCATATMWEALKAIGLVARPFIPHREKHGYGLSERSLAAVLAEKKPDLLITVDNGIVAHGAFAQLRELGVDAILTDHHQPEVAVDGAAVFPPALAVVHTTQLCGTTVAWFVARELNEAAAGKSLELGAIATIADQMQLFGGNRAFVVHGLQALRTTERVGLKLLMSKAGIEQATITTNELNYGIVPRLNAMGRLKHGLDALRLLCTTSLERAGSLVQELIDTNTTRQELTQELIDQAVQRAAEWQDERIIIVESPDFHEGVIGLIAGRLVEQFNKPAIVIALGARLAKGSARSIPGVDIIALIRLVRDDLLEAGGHTMAAGLALDPAKLAIVKQRLQDIARTQIDQGMLEPSLDVDCLLPPHLLTLETAQWLETLAPFGQGNREPTFGIEHATVSNVTAIGRDKKHLKMSLTIENPESTNLQLTALGWGMAGQIENIKVGSLLKTAGKLSLNRWREKVDIQLTLNGIWIGK